jgi:hypothetical protein
MLELLELIIASPLGAAAGAALQNSLAAIILSDCDDCGFNDLGKLLFGGLILAIAVGIASSLIWRRTRDSRPDLARFNSIRPRDRDE